jgi:hypothetical protein
MAGRAYPLPPHARRAAAVLFGLLSFTYGYFFWAGNTNENSRLDATRAMVEDQALHINRFTNSVDIIFVRRLPADRAKKPGPARWVFSNKAPGTSLWAAPFWAAFYYGFSWLPDGDRITVAHYLTKSVCLGLATAAAMAFMLLWLWRVTDRPLASVMVALGVGLGTPLFPYALLYFSHTLAAAALFGAFYLAWSAAHDPAAARPWRMAACGALSSSVVVLEYPSAIAAGLFAIYFLYRIRDARLRWAAAAGAALPLAAMLAYQWGISGHFAYVPYQELSPRPTGYVVNPGGLSVIRGTEWDAIPLILFGATRGLFYLCPWLVFGLMGWVAMALRRDLEKEALLFALMTIGMVAFYSITMTRNALWQGGAALGPRFMLVAVPFLALPIAFLPRPVLGAAFPFMLYSVVTMATSSSVDAAFRQEVKDPFFEMVLPSVAANLFTNSPREGFTAHHWMADSLSWNLGGLAGLPPTWRLAPLYAAWIIAGLWLIRLAAAANGAWMGPSNPRFATAPEAKDPLPES